MLYLTVALGCLRCIAIFNEHAVPHGPGVVTDAVRNELILRRELYMLCNRTAIYLTMAIFVTLPVLYFIHPAIKLGHRDRSGGGRLGGRHPRCPTGTDAKEGTPC